MARSGAASFRLRNLLVDVNATASTVEESVSTVSHSSSQPHDHPATSTVGIVIAVGFLIGLALCMYAIFQRHRQKRAEERKPKDLFVQQSLLGPLQPERVKPLNGKLLVSNVMFNFDSLRWVPKHVGFTLSQLSVATNNFDEANVLGEGGFGKVYHGILPIPPYTRIAIKVLRHGGTQGLKEFITEVEVLSRLDHEHLVRLLGHCVTEDDRILVYRHVANGNLADHLHKGVSKGPRLSWAIRLKIALGAALGVYHLHKQSPKILHRDIKAANILLTRSFNAKVCDFGFAKQVCATPLQSSTLSQTLKAYNCTPSRSCAIGTLGYVAPETFATGEFSGASDVYSFGVLLLELFSGRKSVDITKPDREKSLVVWARHALEEGTISKLLDPTIPAPKSISSKAVLQFAKLALSCVENEPHARPNMVDVVDILQSIQTEHNAQPGSTIIDLHESVSGSEQEGCASNNSSSSLSEDSSNVFYELTSSNFASPSPEFANLPKDEEVQSSLRPTDMPAEEKGPSSWLSNTLGRVLPQNPRQGKVLTV